LTDIKLSDLEYDRELGEEAEKVSIRAKADAILFYYDNRKLLDHLGSLLSNQIKKGFILEKNKLSYSVKKVEKEENGIRIVLTVKSNAVTDVSPVQIIQVVKGTSVNSLESKLKQQFKAEGFRLDVKPNILLLNSWMPFFSKNITVKTSSL
jgi:ribosome-interacting GTPase 1